MYGDRHSFAGTATCPQLRGHGGAVGRGNFEFSMHLGLLDQLDVLGCFFPPT